MNGGSHARQSVCRSILLVQRYIDEQYVWPEKSAACRKVKPELSRATENFEKSKIEPRVSLKHQGFLLRRIFSNSLFAKFPRRH